MQIKGEILTVPLVKVNAVLRFWGGLDVIAWFFLTFALHSNANPHSPLFLFAASATPTRSELV